MITFLNFIKDWVPSIGVIGAGIWVLFNFFFGEWLRRQKEGPSLDGKLSASIIPFDNGKLLVTIEALWNNHSPFPLYLDIHQSRIDVFAIVPDKQKVNRAIEIKKHDLGDPICRHLFLEKACELNYFFEPNTSSTIIDHFILAPGIYGIRMELITGIEGINWWKDLILDARHPKSDDDAAS